MAARSSIDSTDGLLDEEKTALNGLRQPTASNKHVRTCRSLCIRPTRCTIATLLVTATFLILVSVHAARSDAATPVHQAYRPSRVSESDLPGSTEIRRRLEKGLDAVENVAAFDKTQWPRRIFQTWRDHGMEDLRNTWIDLNPGWQYELMLDEEAATFVKETYSFLVPDIWSTWQHLNMPVLRADLFRYLVLYRHGGVYADVDVKCTRSISDWLESAQWDDRNAHSLNEPDATEDKLILRHWTRAFGFVQYAMAAKPFSPTLREVIVRCLLRLHYIAHEQKVPSMANITWSGLEVLYTTGPEAWTQAVLDTLDAVEEPEQTWRKQIQFVEQPTVKSGVIVMPINAFAAGQLHSGSLPTFLTDQVCLEHRGLGTWKVAAKEAWQTSLPTFKQIISIVDDLFKWMWRSATLQHHSSL